MDYSFSSIISPRSLYGSPKKFEFETQNAQDYVDTLEENLAHHAKLLKSLIMKKQSESYTEQQDPELKPALSLEKLIDDLTELYKRLKKVGAERKKFVSIQLISELLEHEHNEKYSEIVADYEERLQEIRFHIDRKDKIIYDLQRSSTELEIQSNYKQNNENLLIIPLNNEILPIYSNVEDIRESICDMSEKINFSYNYKNYLIDLYRAGWRKTQILQALLRNPVNLNEGSGKFLRLDIENEEPDLTLEFEESEIEDFGHARAFTLNDESFDKPSHNRHTLSSGKELILAVKSKLISKIEKTEKKIGNLSIEFQKLADVLLKEGEENFNLISENTALTNQLKKFKLMR